MLSMYDDKVKLRLKKADGQLNAVLRMMEAEKDCKDVITQLSAVRSAVDRAIGMIKQVLNQLKD